VDALPEEGSILAGRYRVGQTLGKGGMGVVVEATHLQLGTRVAIKVLRKEALDEPTMLERFLREARSAAQLRGEHVCRVTDFGTTDDGIPFMVMEHLEGEDLKTILDASGPLDPTLTATYILQACIGVAEAHALGIVHRDLKPGNLFLARLPDGRSSIKLLDFGIAKSTATTIDGSLTSTTKAMGSPAYMSPEQLMASTTLDARSDVWSLGVTMFELLTENRPFDGDTPYELALRIANEPAAPIPDTVPPELAKIVARCLTKDREKRIQSVADLAAALAPLVRNGKELAASARAALASPTGATPRASRSHDIPSSPATETTLRGASGAITSDTRSRSRLLLPLALVFTTLLVVAGVMVWRSRDSADGTDRTPAASPDPKPAPPPVAPPPVVDAAPAPVAIDAAIADEPSDAAVAEPPDAAVQDPPKDPKKKPPPRRRPRPTPDFSESRY
jgi:serine/threonine-protein kinase